MFESLHSSVQHLTNLEEPVDFFLFFNISCFSFLFVVCQGADFVDATKELVPDAGSGHISRDLHHCPLFGHGTTIRHSPPEAVLLLLRPVRHSLDHMFLHRRPHYDFLGGEASNQSKMAERDHLAKGKRQ